MKGLDPARQISLVRATGRSIEAIAREKDRQWASGQGEITEPKKKKRRKAVVDPASLAKAKAAPMPGFIEPSLATATEQAPSGKDWLHEIKHDGYRLQAHLLNGKVTLYSRQGLDWTERFPSIAQALVDAPAKAAIADTAWLAGAWVVIAAAIVLTVITGVDYVVSAVRDSRGRPAGH